MLSMLFLFLKLIILKTIANIAV